MAFEAFERGGIEEALPFFHPDIEWTADLFALDPQTYRGHDGLRRYVQGLTEEFADFRNQPQEFIATNGQLIAWVLVSGRGLQSGVPVEQRVAELCAFRDGLIRRVRMYRSLEEALEVARSNE
jgi:ketosteroid isomerase-like protein